MVLAKQATDMYTRRVIEYPWKGPSKYKYDFHFTKKGSWYYVDSCNSAKTNRWNGHKKVVEGRGEDWRIVETKTGEIISTSQTDVPADS